MLDVYSVNIFYFVFGSRMQLQVLSYFNNKMFTESDYPARVFLLIPSLIIRPRLYALFYCLAMSKQN